ncbi:receptor-like protein 52 [Quercus suber]|uniref:Receptor-like protein 52 n=1 Tax=Quercus suber TaxID=58331 RepID=A0AAW0KGW8_QUESU
MSYVNLIKASVWQQVTDTLSSLFELRLSYSQLPFIPPTPTVNFSSLVVDLHNMTSLRHLDLSENNFNSSIPNWLYSFNRLELLNLGSSNLQGTISNAIGNLTSAISIDLLGNELGGKLPRSLDNISSDHLNSYGSSNPYGESFPLESALLMIKGKFLEYSTILQLRKLTKKKHKHEEES